MLIRSPLKLNVSGQRDCQASDYQTSDCDGDNQRPECSEAKLLKLLVESDDALVIGSLGTSLLLLNLGVMEGGGLDLSLLLEGGDEVALGPSSDGGEVAKRAVVAASLEAESAEGIWDDHALLRVVWEWAAIEDLQLAESGGTSWELVGEHATDALPENASGGLPVLGTAAWVRVNALLHGVLSNDLVSLEGTGLEDLLTADNGDALSIEKLLCNHTGEAALQVASSVND